MERHCYSLIYRQKQWTNYENGVILAQFSWFVYFPSGNGKVEQSQILGIFLKSQPISESFWFQYAIGNLGIISHIITNTNEQVTLNIVFLILKEQKMKISTS